LLPLFFAGLLANAQPKVGVVEIFGLRKVSPEKVRKALGVLEGGPLPASKVDIEERLEAVDGLVKASVEAVCCLDKQAILYVGVEERGAPHFETRLPPNHDLSIPGEVMEEWTNFTTNIAVAVRRGTAEEDLTQGHSLVKDAGARQSQLKFVDLAEKHQALLKQVLHNAGDEQQRAIAAYVLGYLADKKAAESELQFAMQDFDSTVRINAMRGLVAITVLSTLKPELGLKVSPTWFVEMLNSSNFTDRLKAAEALFHFTGKRDEHVMAHIRERALPSLMEMAAWREPGHAVPAFILLGRMAGLGEEEIQDLWKKGDRQALLKKVSGKSSN
jgi:hypothetical protein